MNEQKETTKMHFCNLSVNSDEESAQQKERNIAIQPRKVKAKQMRVCLIDIYQMHV